MSTSPQLDTRKAHTLPSSLECLPTEFIQNISLHTSDFNIAVTSPTLARILRKERELIYLILLAFCSDECIVYGAAQFLLVNDLTPMSAEDKSRLRTTVLNNPNCTLALFRRCQRFFIEQVIRQKWLRAGIIRYEDEIIGGDPTELEILEERWERWERWETTDYWDITVHGYDSGDRDKTLDIILESGYINITDEETCQLDNYQMPNGDPRYLPYLPNRLLRRPWTNEKIEFLMMFNFGRLGCKESSSQRDADLAVTVLTELIEDKNVTVLRTVLSMDPGYTTTHTIGIVVKVDGLSDDIILQ